MLENFIPIRNTQKDLFHSPNVNFSLYSPRMVDWSTDGITFKPQVDDDHNHNKGIITQLKEQSVKSFAGIKTLLEQKHSMQQAYINFVRDKALHTFTIHAKLISPFITGLGSGHPTETGMILDRNLGVPYIPASSIKGVLRTAYAVNLAKEGKTKKDKPNEVEDALLNKFFGSVDSKGDDVVRGQLFFLDAYPESIPELKVDIMNPHYSKYYNKDHKLPLENESPVPIKFLSVKEGVSFSFRCFFMPLETNKYCDNSFTEKDKTEVNNAFETAFSVIGFGGKTAIGYGRFKTMSDSDIATQKKVAEQKVQEQKNALRPKPGDMVNGVIIGKNKKGTLWQVAINGDKGMIGIVMNSSSTPSDLKENDEIRVKIKSDSKTSFNVDYVPNV